MRQLAPIVCATLLLSFSRAGAESGAPIYRAQCAPCHGADGRGNGPDAAFLAKKPRDLRDGALKRYSTADLVAKIRAGRELPISLDEGAVQARSQEVESLISYLRSIPSIDWEQVETGEVIYSERCAKCHGETGKPEGKLPAGVSAPRDLSDPGFHSSISDAELVQVVRHGRVRMPAIVPRVKESDGPALAAYVRLLSPGYTSYEEFCMSCHGRDGHGAGTLGEEIPLPTVVFDAAYFKRTDPEVLRTRVWHMVAEHQTTMPHYRWGLSEAQARAVAEYMQHSWK